MAFMVTFFGRKKRAKAYLANQQILIRRGVCVHREENWAQNSLQANMIPMKAAECWFAGPVRIEPKALDMTADCLQPALSWGKGVRFSLEMEVVGHRKANLYHMH